MLFANEKACYSRHGNVGDAAPVRNINNLQIIV